LVDRFLLFTLNGVTLGKAIISIFIIMRTSSPIQQVGPISNVILFIVWNEEGTALVNSFYIDSTIVIFFILTVRRA
jgi:hypothetical protein